MILPTYKHSLYGNDSNDAFHFEIAIQQLKLNVREYYTAYGEYVKFIWFY